MEAFQEKLRRGSESFPLSYYRHRPGGCFIRPHWHPEVELVYGIGGKTAVTVGDKSHVLKAGEMLLIAPRLLHSYRAITQSVEYEAAVFDMSLFRFRGAHFFDEEITKPLMRGELTFPGLIDESHECHKILRPVVSRFFNEDRDSKAAAFADLVTLLSILSEKGFLTRVSSEDSEGRYDDIKRSIRYMDDHFSQKITLAKLASIANMSPNYFCAYFKAKTGVSAFEQLNYIRIDKACDMLLDRDSSIVDIAESCGYENVGYFIRKFKEIRGCTPSVYRKSHA